MGERFLGQPCNAVVIVKVEVMIFLTLANCFNFEGVRFLSMANDQRIPSYAVCELTVMRFFTCFHPADPCCAIVVLSGAV